MSYSRSKKPFPIKAFSITIRKLIMIPVLGIIMCSGKSMAQNQSTLAIMPVDVRELSYSGADIASMIRMETEKLKVVSILDPYEIEEVFAMNEFNPERCFSKNCLTKAGKLLGVDQVLSGTFERFGSKIIVTVRLLDVASENFVASDVMEYILLPEELQRMIRVSVHRLFDKNPDQILVDQLTDVERPVVSDRNLLELDGPRFGFTYTTGANGERLQSARSEGGYDMFPATFIIGYQKEFRYQSTGNFQALVEVIGTLGGLESGYLIPTATFLNGFRWGKSGWEIGFGPTIRLVKTADGFYDAQGNWHLERLTINSENYPVVNRIDRRGELQSSVGLLLAAGRTFQSGHLNIPVNVFYSPRKEGSTIGLSCGFNISRK